MTPNTRSINQSELNRHAFIEQMKGVCTSIPAHVVTFNPEIQRAQIQIGIETVLVGEVTENPRVIEDVPVIFPGGDFTMEFEVGKGAEGALFFSQRCIDGWKNSGGIAANPHARFFDRQDCYFVPGLRSQPGAITGFQNNGIRLRNKAGNQHAWLKNDGSVELVNSGGFVRLLANGNVNINGVIFTPGATIDFRTHKHSGVETGGGNTGNPIS